MLFCGTPGLARFSEDSVPSIDVSETDEAIEVTTDLPEIKAEDVDIEVHDDDLTISSETLEEKWSEEGTGFKDHRPATKGQLLSFGSAAMWCSGRRDTSVGTA